MTVNILNSIYTFNIFYYMFQMFGKLVTLQGKTYLRN